MKTIHKTVLCLTGFLLGTFIFTHAQQLISPVGNFFQGSTASISFSLGEPLIETTSGISALLTQGFQQPDFTGVQILHIAAGWSGISTWLNPGNCTIENMFQPVINQIVILKNTTGVFWPSQNVNTLGTWNFKDGYILKSDYDYDLRVYGYKTDDPTVVLSAGWSLLPVISGSNVPVSVFDPLQGTVKVVKEIAGWKIYWPEQNIATLNVLEPGKSYFILMASTGTLTFPANLKHVTAKPDVIRNSNPCWNMEINTPASHLICIEKQAMTGFSPGDFIGIFTNEGICSGQVEIAANEDPTVIVAFSDDEITWTKEGFSCNETMKFVRFNVTRGEETAVVPIFNPTLPDFIGAFVPNGLSSISGFKTAGIAGFSKPMPVMNIFPNPCDGVFSISETLPGTSIMVTDIGGRPVNHAFSEVNGRINVDISGNPPGLYFVKIEYKGVYTVKKVVLN